MRGWKCEYPRPIGPNVFLDSIPRTCPVNYYPSIKNNRFELADDFFPSQRVAIKVDTTPQEVIVDARGNILEIIEGAFDHKVGEAEIEAYDRLWPGTVPPPSNYLGGAEATVGTSARSNPPVPYLFESCKSMASSSCNMSKLSARLENSSAVLGAWT